MAHSGDVFGRGTIFHGYYSFRDHIRRARTDHVYAQNFVCIFIGQYFDESIQVHARTGAAGGFEWETSCFVGTSLFFQLLFGETYGQVYTTPGIKL